MLVRLTALLSLIAAIGLTIGTVVSVSEGRTLFFYREPLEDSSFALVVEGSSLRIWEWTFTDRARSAYNYDKSAAGFGILVERATTPHQRGLLTHRLTVPAPVLTTLLTAYPLLVWIRGPLRRLRRRRLGQCIHCGYHLTGNTTGVCSECGRAFDVGHDTPAPQDPDPVPWHETGPTRRQTWWPGAIIALLCLGLYLPGINWGLPGLVSWSQDTIAGVRTLGAVSTWPSQWAGRYPPLQYFIARAAYEPVLMYWQSKGQLATDPQSGQLLFANPQAPKITLLTYISRAITVIMAVGAVFALWLAAMVLTQDRTAAAFAAVAFGTGAAFVYFAHLGNVDVPSIFWFCVSLIFYFRLLRGGSMRSSGLLGLAGALCISTKDNWAGMYAGMAVVLLISEWRRLRRDGRAWPSAKALLQSKWLVGVIAFILPYALLNGIPWNWSGWLDRLNALADTVHQSERRHAFFNLPLVTFHQAAGAVGWPMLTAILAAGLWLIRRSPWTAFVLAIPCLAYYLIVIQRIGFVYERFLFAPIALGCVAVGIWLAAYLRERRPLILRMSAPLVLFVPTAAYAIAVDLEMIHDSRYEAEEWFEKNISKETSIGALTASLEHFSPQYLPRVHEMGFATYPVLALTESFKSPQPQLLMLSGFDRTDFKAENDRCVMSLTATYQAQHYQVIKDFSGRFLGSWSSWLSAAGWYAPPPGKISPKLWIYEKRGEAPTSSEATTPQPPTIIRTAPGGRAVDQAAGRGQTWLPPTDTMELLLSELVAAELQLTPKQKLFMLQAYLSDPSISDPTALGLTAEQRTRLEQIQLQIAGGRALLWPNIAQALALTPQQKSTLIDIEQTIAREGFDTVSRIRFASTEALEAYLNNYAYRRVFSERFLSVLTEEQRKKLQELYGPKFDVDAYFREKGVPE